MGDFEKEGSRGAQACGPRDEQNIPIISQEGFKTMSSANKGSGNIEFNNVREAGSLVRRGDIEGRTIERGHVMC